MKRYSSEEVELIRQSASLVAKTHGEIAEMIKPGVTLIEIDRKAESFIRDQGGLPAFKGYNGFPNALCMSLNEQVVHGIPTEKELKEGDIISVDCGVEMNGFFGDSAYTYPVGEIDPEVMLLLERTKKCLELGIEQAVDGNRVGDIGAAIQRYAESFGYGVVRELVGHGVGAALHEKPEVPNYGKKGRGAKLKSGMVLAIEPMINLGTERVKQLNDGWTILSTDRKPSAHYEHTVLVSKGRAELLSSFEFIEQRIGALNG